MDLNNLVKKTIEAFAQECNSTMSIHFGYRIMVNNKMYSPKIKATAPYVAAFCGEITGDTFNVKINEIEKDQEQFEIVFERSQYTRDKRKVISCWNEAGDLKRYR